MSERDPIDRAERAGPLANGWFRSVVYEPDGRVGIRDHATLGSATEYADDAASEREHGIVLAYVLDDRFVVVHVGTHYASAPAPGSGARNRT